VSERNPCAFCHVPHSGKGARPGIAPIHVPYDSSTMTGRPGAPTGTTRICLSCHDGTIAVGQTIARRIMTNIATIPADRPSNLGTDLRKTHPVSFVPAAGAGTRAPPPHDPVAFDRNGQVQCTSCHDPHSEFGGDPAIGMFLVKPTRNSELCLTCHDPTWAAPADGSHARAPAAAFTARGIAPGHVSVGEAGCRACHRSHGADPGGRILDRPRGDDDALCMRCHDGTIARRNLASDWTKPYAHGGQPRVHDAAEGRPGSARPLPEKSPSAQRHATCVDCHEPHAAAAGRATAAPAAPPALAGAWGVDESGQRVERVQFEYEVCFKCHGDSANKPQTTGTRPADTLRRAMTDANLRRQLSRSAPSFHPVVAPGRNSDVPSLLPPYGPASMIFCSDCHASDSGPGAGGAGARGPHGSAYPALLERNYTTRDFTVESPAAYALCYKCHDRNVLLSDRSAFRLHRRHVVNSATPCSACHASHGVSPLAGNPEENAHLIDFDLSIVAPSSGARWYRSTGARMGSCNLTCHSKIHDPNAVPPTAPDVVLGKY
jgi:predicted CXXCH cytochrome family protein